MFAAYSSVRPIQVPIVGYPRMGSRFMGQTPEYVTYDVCPLPPRASSPSGGGTPGATAYAISTPDPTLNCMRDARGNALCSDGTRFPPGCPTTPPEQYFTPGITPDVTTGNRIEGQQPPPRAAGSVAGAPSGGSPIVPIAAGAAGLAAIGTVAYFLLR